MFHILPQECLFLIISFVIQYNPPREEQQERVYRKTWQNGVSKSQLPRIHLKEPLWKPPPFVSMIPLTLAHRTVFDTNEVWTYLYEQEFRKGKKPYVRKQPNAKAKFFQKAKDIIKQRYTPMLQCKKEHLQQDQEKLRINLHQIHTLDLAFSEIKPQIRKRENIDININHVRVILSNSVTLPSGYVYPWGHIVLHPLRLDVRTAGYYRESHQKVGEEMIFQIEKAKNSIHKMERILSNL